MRYVLAGFLGGQVAGRLVLAHATSRAGERIALSIYGAIAIGLLAVVQFVDNIPGNAVAITFVGIFFG
jgi:fucose permease